MVRFGSSYITPKLDLASLTIYAERLFSNIKRYLPENFKNFPEWFQVLRSGNNYLSSVLLSHDLCPICKL